MLRRSACDVHPHHLKQRDQREAGTGRQRRRRRRRRRRKVESVMG
jgi:hypothetical protein